jgi:predicted nucleic acid-binding protein
MANRNTVFIDTSGWIATLNADDVLYGSARRQLVQLGVQRRSLVTTDWVLAETGNGLARTAARARFADAVRRFLESPHCRLVRVDAALFDRAMTLYSQMEDKSWGLVDCASFVVMQEEGIVDAFTSDRHFAQAGFQNLLPTT